MQGFIDVIRKIVVMVLVLELVIQLQPGKNYEPYLKMFVGLFMIYSLMSGVMGSAFQSQVGKTWSEYIYDWLDDETYFGFGETEYGTTEDEGNREGIGKIEVPIKHIKIEKIEVERIGKLP